MKFEGTRPSAADKDVDVYTFSVGQEELRLLHAVVRNFYRLLPGGLQEVSSTKSRARNMSTVMSKTLSEYRIRH